MEQKFNPVAAAVQAKGGKITDLARALGVSHQAVSLWLKDGRIPLSRVVQVSEVTGIPKHVLRHEFAPSGKAAQN